MDTTVLTAAALFVASACAVVVAARQRRRPIMSKDALLALRKQHVSSSLSVSYENSNPLWIVKVRGI